MPINKIVRINDILKLNRYLGKYLIESSSGLLIACRFSVQNLKHRQVLIVFCSPVHESFLAEFHRSPPLDQDQYFLTQIIETMNYWLGIKIKTTITKVNAYPIEQGLVLDLSDSPDWINYLSYLRWNQSS